MLLLLLLLLLLVRRVLFFYVITCIIRIMCIYIGRELEGISSGRMLHEVNYFADRWNSYLISCIHS